LLCDEGHLLDPSLEKDDRMVYCSVCHVRRSNFSFECSLCGFNLCEKCIDYECRTKKDEIVLCPNRHGMTFSEDPKVCFVELFGNFQCLVCCVEVVQFKCFHCLKCKILFCESCYSSIRNGILNGVNIRCVMDHALQYVFNLKVVTKRNLICDLCRSQYLNLGSFSCLDCKFDVCFKCVGLEMNK
jgi:hypothetical protein